MQGLIGLVFVAYICVPQRLVLHFFPDVGHYREPVFFVLVLWMLWLMFKGCRSCEKTSGVSRA